MRKVKLDPDALKVESFDTVARPGRRGTVAGQEQEWTQQMGGYTCQPIMTCFQGGSCPAFSCFSQCDRNCFEDWSNACDFETAQTCATYCSCNWATCSCPPTVNHTCPGACASYPCN